MENTVTFYNKFDFQSMLDDANDGDSIFHYTSLDTLLKIIENKKLRFSNRLYLNDRSEGRYVLDLCQEHIDEIWPVNCSHDKVEFQEALATLVEHLNNPSFQIYQVSLSASGDNLTMWNYYAKGDGVNLCFSASELLKTLKGHLYNNVLGPVEFLHGYVIYDQDRQIEILKTMLEKFSKTEPTLNEWPLFTSWAMLHMGAFFKQNGFQDEKEYRITYNLTTNPKHLDQCTSLFPEDRHEPYHIGVYQKEHMLVPFVDVDFPASAIKGICLSPRLSIENISDGLKIVLSKSGIKPSSIKISKSTIPVRF